MSEAPPHLSLICERVRGQMSLELDGELSHLEQALVEAHIEHCQSCLLYRADLFSFTQQLRAAPLERLGAPVALPQCRRHLTMRAAQMVAAAAVVTVGLWSMVGINSGGSREHLQHVRPAF